MGKPTLRGDTLTFEFFTDNTILTKDKKGTYLSADASASAISLAVQSITGMSGTGHLLCVGEIGQEKTELVQTSNGTAPTGTTVALQTNLVFDHPIDTKIYVVPFDQYALSHSSGITSEKGTIATAGLQVDQAETLYRDLNYSAGYGFVQFKNSISGTFSIISDPIPYAGFSDNTVFQIKKRALGSVNEKISEHITNEYLDECLSEARREYHNATGKRTYRRKYNADIGNVSTGMYRIALPTDVEKSHTAENVYGVRIGTQDNMSYYDKKEWDKDYQGVSHSVLLDSYTASTSRDLYLDSVRDFENSGSVEIAGDGIEYSAKGVSGGTLRISTHGSENHSTGDDVWQNASDGLPDKFTVWMDTDGTNYIYFNRPIETAYVNQNIWADYYQTKKTIDSDADELDEPDNVQDGYVHFLAWKIKKRKNNGLDDLKDADYLKWEMIKQQALGNEKTGAYIRIEPNIDHLVIPW